MGKNKIVKSGLLAMGVGASVLAGGTSCKATTYKPNEQGVNARLCYIAKSHGSPNMLSFTTTKMSYTSSKKVDENLFSFVGTAKMSETSSINDFTIRYSITTPVYEKTLASLTKSNGEFTSTVCKNLFEIMDTGMLMGIEWNNGEMAVLSTPDDNNLQDEDELAVY